MIRHSQNGYSAGHPWYYKLGGKRLSLKEIRADVIATGYQGYRARDIIEADDKAEPKRSQTLRAMRAEAVSALREDVSRYRELARELAARRKAGTDEIETAICSCIHTAIGLKHNHIYNELAHLELLDGLLAKQGDLFGI